MMPLNLQTAAQRYLNERRCHQAIMLPGEAEADTKQPAAPPR